jgi:HrpA-like RNA helicase
VKNKVYDRHFQKIKMKGNEEEEKELPIMKYREEILQSIRDFPVTIITGDTGCGKVR